MSVIDSDLRLNRLEMSADSVGNLVIEDLNSIKPSFYEFEITNLTEEELQEQENQLNGSSDDKDKTGATAKRRKGFLFEDFLSSGEEDNSESIKDVGISGITNKLQNKNQQGEPPKNLPANLESIEQF